jgi:hypothetical protein
MSMSENLPITELQLVDGEIGEKALRFYPGETVWHSDWKKAFPAHYREKTFLNKSEGYYHRADVFTPCATAIEFQNSPITLEELRSREAFYPNLVWVVNGAKFKGFKILKHLPDIDSPRLDAFEFCHKANLSMVRKSDLLLGLVQPKVMTFHHPELRNIPFTAHYYSFRWSNPHRVWYEAKCPIIIDLGGYFLYQLKQRKQSNGDYAYLHMIPRKDFIARYLK